MEAGSNGKAKQVHLVLTYSPMEGTLQIGGEVPNVDMAINICQQAIRELDTQLRQAKALAFQQQLKESASSARIADILTRTRPR